MTILHTKYFSLLIAFFCLSALSPTLAWAAEAAQPDDTSTQAPTKTTNIIDWNTALNRFRSEGYPQGCMLYIGRTSNLFVRKVESGEINCRGMDLIVLAADDKVINPYTNKETYGSEVINLYAGLVAANPAGSIFFLDKNMLPRVVHNMHHLTHRNKPERINLMTDYITREMDGQLVCTKMGLTDFASITGGQEAKDIIMQMAMELKNGDISTPQMVVMKFLSKQIAAEDCILAFDVNNEKVDPANTAGRIFVVTNDPKGSAFLAMVVEMAYKLRTTDGNNNIVQPPMTFIGPIGADYSHLELMGIKFEVAYASEQNIKAKGCPRTILSGNAQKGGIVVEVYGYIQGDVMGSLMQISVQDRTALAPDLPIGELDWEPEQ